MIEFEESGLRNHKIMYEYRNQSAYEVLVDVFGGQVSTFIEPNGIIKGFVNIYINENHILNIKTYCLSDGDKILLVSSLSGG